MRYELMLAGFSLVAVVLCIHQSNATAAIGFGIAALAEIELDHYKKGRL